MGILEDITGEADSDKLQTVEVVTLCKDITEGVEFDKERPFPSLEDALKYAQALPQDERDISFIRTSEVVETLDKAEMELREKPCDDNGTCPPSGARPDGTE